MATGLAMVAGFVDAYGIITYGVYVSFMSGNTTQTGYQTAEGAFGPVALSALAILFFVGGSFAGTLLVQFTGRRARRVVFGVVAAALAAVVVFTQLGPLSAGVLIAMVSFAMGVMNTALSRVGAQSVSLTFVTGTLSRVGANLALALRRAPFRTRRGRGTLICAGPCFWLASGPGSWPARCCRGQPRRGLARGCYWRRC